MVFLDTLDQIVGYSDKERPVGFVRENVNAINALARHEGLYVPQCRAPRIVRVFAARIRCSRSK